MSPLASPARLARVLAPALALVLLSTTASAASASTADLAVSNPEFTSDHTVGSSATYTVQVTNNGPDATEATVGDQLGEAESLVSATTTQGSCTQAVPVICSLGSVAPGAAVTLQIQVTYTKASSYNEHTVAVTGPETNTDPDPNNDRGGVSFQVTEPEEPFVPAPEAETGGWTRTQATLVVEAELSPHGSGTYYFEYGRTKAYGKRTDAKAVKGEDALERKATIDGLDMNTKYHYRVVLVVDGKKYRGKDKTGTTLGKLLYGPMTLKVVKRSASSTHYEGVLGGGMADAPGACKGTVTVTVYTTANVDLLRRQTKLRDDCTYDITIPFGPRQARKYGPKGTVLVQANFLGNRAVARVGTASDRP
jgi:uncharacterized repeat protein (TIGR01451 family)